MRRITNFFSTTRKINRISWGAVISGALTTIAIMFLFNLLGIGIGFASIDPLQESEPLEGLGIGTAIWWIVSNLLALFAGGWVAGRMAGYPSPIDGALHGFIAWTVYALVSVIFVGSAVGSAISGVASATSQIFGGGDTKEVVVNLKKLQNQNKKETTTTYNEVKEEVLQLMQAGERYNLLPENTSEEARSTIQNSKSEVRESLRQLNLEEKVSEFFNDLNFDLDKNGNLDISVEGDKDYFEKEEIKDYLTENTDLTEAEINGVITKWERKLDKAAERAEELYKKAKQKAEKAADEAAKAIAKVSLVSFFMFLLGATAALLAGSLGSPTYTVLEEERIHEEDNFRRDEDYRRDI
ncbi:hypothetical protein HX109_15150 [Galbibacter sp. BG1]|uniref:TIGR04086 family membrane protein n=1 Tax=Galbibacter sp. BG1 TaxID=1170699 RepID=UPI0015B9723F|nr:TIGR04086 family membrane protein [Galbibacter sp. BG1]QLE02837.1 hypothetical protein HX109_15150 [Galbibacter sp. BG1]